MYNNLDTSSLQFGPSVKRGITFKTNQPGFDIFTRKSYHNFKITINTQNYCQSAAYTLSDIDAYVITDRLSINIFNQKDFTLR